MDFLILFALIYYMQTVASQQEEAICMTRNGQWGHCTPLYSCKNLTEMLEAYSNPVYWREIIEAPNGCRNDTEEKICCPEIDQLYESRIMPQDDFQHPNIKLLPEYCGESSESPKILGGSETDVNEFPWMARLKYNVYWLKEKISTKKLINVLAHNGTFSEEFSCAGTIINERYILTAAHCVIGRDLFSVRVGDYNYTENNCTDDERDCAPQNLDIEDVITFADLMYGIEETDISLIRLKTPIIFTQTVGAICLPLEENEKNYDNIVNKRGQVTGWGLTENGKPSPDLLKATFYVKNLSLCQEKYSKRELKNHLCVQANKGDSCFGDSGAPLQIRNSDSQDYSKYVQYGIVSFRKEPSCALLKSLTVQVKVSYFVNWILDNIKP